MTRRKRILSIILWLLSLLWLLLALFLSSQTGVETGALSRRIAEALGRLLHVSEHSMAAFHSMLRTAAHVVVYFVLAVLVCGATLATFPTYRIAFLDAMLACIAISVFDEYRKAFIPGRHCTWSEAGLNVLGCAAGALTALVIYKLLMWLGKGRRTKMPDGSY